MKLHEIKSLVEETTGLTVFDVNEGVEVTVTGDRPEMVSVIREKLERAGLPFSQSKHRRFKGATFTIPLRNTGTSFNANWEVA